MTSNKSGSEAQARLSLGAKPAVGMKMTVPRGAFGPSTRVDSKFGQPGQGSERQASGLITVFNLEIFGLKP
jgi:hypothetical protein